MIDELVQLRQALQANLITLDNLISQLNQPVIEPAVVNDTAHPDLLDPDWPAAWPQYLLADCHTEKEKAYRAMQIVSDYDLSHIENKKILDFGCGDGLVAKELTKRHTNGISAYDIAPDKMWDNLHHPDLVLLSDLKQVIENGPYDTILIHDVIDHAPSKVFESHLQQIIDKCGGDVKIILTAHPFTSRHGGHLHESKNLAYLHLLYSEEQLAKLQIRCPFNNRWSRPQAAYENMFARLNLAVLNKVIDNDPIEPWIRDRLIPIITKRIYDNQISVEQAERILSVSWVQYTLGRETRT